MFLISSNAFEKDCTFSFSLLLLSGCGVVGWQLSPIRKVCKNIGGLILSLFLVGGGCVQVYKWTPKFGRQPRLRDRVSSGSELFAPVIGSIQIVAHLMHGPPLCKIKQILEWIFQKTMLYAYVLP